MKSWQEMGFELETTADGSPTLRLREGTGEAMHHSGGALSETLFIYGRAVDAAFRALESPRFFSLGLGMGYNELVVAAAALAHARGFRMCTFESVSGLREVFCTWLNGEDTFARKDFDVVLEIVSAAWKQPPDAVKKSLRAALANGEWCLRGAFGPGSEVDGRFHVFLYDAFSAKTSSPLWDEVFLTDFLRTHSEEDALFTTYACRGSLKRALRACQYDVIERSGFGNKRNSTAAVRGLKVPLDF